tara:strand:- start:716 stop:1039 length:324 start_codon:yes stop_codon:yes gene_type:complete
MANTFKNALSRNVGTSAVEVYAAPASKNAICIELDVCNTTNGGVTVDAYITKAGANYYIIKNAPVPVGGSLQVIAGQKIVLSDTDSLNVLSSVNSSLDIIASILEDV